LRIRLRLDLVRSAGGVDVAGSPLEEAWKKAKEYVELLTLKMNALWQQFYGLSDVQNKGQHSTGN
jgi:hypothetical protein